jgi:hypothetical protein
MDRAMPMEINKAPSDVFKNIKDEFPIKLGGGFGPFARSSQGAGVGPKALGYRQ